jgi:hypothetical protein
MSPKLRTFMRGIRGSAASLSSIEGNYQVDFQNGAYLKGTGTQVMNVGNGQPFTVRASFYARSQGGANYGVIVAKDDRDTSKMLFEIHLESGNLVGYVFSDTSHWYGQMSGPVSLNAWHRVALVYPGGTTEPLLYLDGVLQTGTPYNNGGTFSGTFNTTGDFTIGQAYFENRYFDGNIRDVWVWNSALSAAEIAVIDATNTPPDPRVNTGDYVSSGNLIHGYPLRSDTIDLVTPNAVEDVVGSGDLTGKNFDIVKFVGASSQRLSAGAPGVITSNAAFSMAWDVYLDSHTGSMITMDQRSAPTMTFNFQNYEGAACYTYLWDQNNGQKYLGKEGTQLGIGSWKRIVVTWDGSSTLKQYQNGTEHTTVFASGGFSAMNNFAAEFLIGCSKETGSYVLHLSGRIRTVARWSSVLTQAEVTEFGTASLMGHSFDFSTNSGNYASAGNLVNYWKFAPRLNDLTTTDGLLDYVGTKHLTGTNFTRPRIVAYTG